MKKILLLNAFIALASCSSDDANNDVNNSCDCQKIIGEYNETTQTFQPTSSAFYSNNCNDRTTVANQDENGDYYIITCVPNQD